MGMYTGLRFKGVIKDEYREDFKKIFTPHDYEDQEIFDWIDSKHPDLFLFGTKSRASSVRNTGNLAYMPWEEDGDTSYNGFDEQTGELNFQCSIKNYESELEAFIRIIPNFTKELLYCELLYEEWQSGRFYRLLDGKIFLVQKEVHLYD